VVFTGRQVTKSSGLYQGYRADIHPEMLIFAAWLPANLGCLALYVLLV